jgi:predicted acyl esterase
MQRRIGTGGVADVGRAASVSRVALGSAVLLAIGGGVGHAQEASAARPVVEQVAMRDGVRLATAVWRPEGAGPWPVALARTPYNKDAIRGDRFLKEGIVLVAQDVRGRFASEGVARPFADDAWGERQDGLDTVNWIRRQPWCSGRIATFGGSAVGITQLLLAGAGPEGIAGQHVVVAPVSLFHGCFYQDGVFRKALVEDWLRMTNWPPEVLPWLRQHATYDAYWQTQDLRNRLPNVRWPVVHVGGWFDIFAQGTIDAFTELQARGGPGARGRQRLVMGPWTHGVYQRKAGDFLFPENAVRPPGMPDEFGWLRFWLTGRPEVPVDLAPVHYYVMGDVDDPKAPGNTWRAVRHFPPPSRPYRLYLTADGGLVPERPSFAATREYDYDPANPVPTVGGAELTRPPGPRDQRPVECRKDVLVFSTPLLEKPLEVTGRVRVRLDAATSARDTDFSARLCDVYPDGRSMLIADGIIRASYRRSLARPEPVAPGRRATYDIDLGSTSIIFNRGHRIRVAITSSNAPRFEPNPNTGEPWRPSGGAAPVVARQRVSLGGSEASHIILPTIREDGR